MHINLLIEFVTPYLVDDQLRALTQVSKSYSRDISLVLTQVRDTGLHYESACYVADFRKNVEYVSKRLKLLHVDAHDTFIMKAFAAACYNNDMKMAGWINRDMYYTDPTYTDNTDLLGCSLDTGLYYANDEYRDNIKWIFLNLCVKQDASLDTIKELYQDYVRKYVTVNLQFILETVCGTSQRLDVAKWLYAMLSEQQRIQFANTHLIDQVGIMMNNNTTAEFLDWYLSMVEHQMAHRRVPFARSSLVRLLENNTTRDKIARMLTYLVNRYGTLKYNPVEATLLTTGSPYSIMMAVTNGKHDVTVVKWMLSRSDALPSIYDSGYVIRCQQSLFEYASRHHHRLFESDIRKWLAEDTRHISDAFVKACRGGQLHALDWLLKNYGLGNFTADTCLNGFRNASREGHVHVLRWLDVNMAPFVSSRTVRYKALKQACLHGSFLTAAYLCDTVNKDDETLFYEVCARKHFHIARLLAPRIQLSPSGDKHGMYDDPLTTLCNMYHHSNHLFHVEWFRKKFEIDTDDVNALLAMVVSN